jgi:hypothetical protein
MNEPSKRCDICRRAAVCWPGVFTVIGPRDLCGDCYWDYRALILAMADYFNRHGAFNKRRDASETNHERTTADT